MPKRYPTQDSFSAGEVSSSFRGRSRSVAYETGLKSCINAIPNSRGPVSRREGFRFVRSFPGIHTAEVFGFEYSEDHAFSLTFYGTTLDIVSVVDVGNTVTKNFNFDAELTGWVSSGDVTSALGYIDLAAGSYVEQVVTVGGSSAYRAAGAFSAGSLTVGTAVGGADLVNQALTAPAQVVAGTFTHTGDVYLRITATSAIRLRMADVYAVGSSVADHTEVTPYTNLAGLLVQMAPGNTSAFVVHPQFPPYELAYDAATGLWTWSAITFVSEPAEWVAGNYPSAVEFHQGRSWWSRVASDPSTFWASKSATAFSDYKDITTGPLADDAMVYTLAQRGEIRWIKSVNSLLVGTSNAEYVVGPSDVPITPGNIDVTRQSSYGSAPASARSFHEGALFIEVSARRIRFMQYTRDYNGWGSRDATYMNDDLTAPGLRFVERHDYEDTITWLLRSPGDLVGYSYSKEISKQGTYGWFRTVLSNSEVLSISAIHHGKYDNTAGSPLYILVLVKVAGVYETHLLEWDHFDRNYLDEYVESYSATPVSSVSGLAHLEGKTVRVWADGADRGDAVVSSGAVTISGDPVYHTVVGVSYTTTLDLLPLVYRDFRGNSDAVYKVNRGSTTLEVHNSVLPSVNGVQVPARGVDTPVGYPETLFTGKVRTPVIGWVVGGEMTISTSVPGPFTLLSVSSEAASEAL